MPSIKRSSCIKGKRGSNIKLSYEDKLDVVSLINSQKLGNRNPKAEYVAKRIISYENDQVTKAKADKIINSLNNSIVKDNKKRWNTIESKRRYDEFMKKYSN